MRRFRFRLARVLALRERESEAHRLALARALTAEQAARWRVERLEDRKAAELAELMAKAAGASATDLIMRRRYLAGLVQAVVQASGQLAAQVRDTEAQRQALARARQRQRTLERLRDRRRAEHEAAASREAQAELDEFGGRSKERE